MFFVFPSKFNRHVVLQPLSPVAVANIGDPRRPCSHVGLPPTHRQNRQSVRSTPARALAAFVSSILQKQCVRDGALVVCQHHEGLLLHSRGRFAG